MKPKFLAIIILALALFVALPVHAGSVEEEVFKDALWSVVFETGQFLLQKI